MTGRRWKPGEQMKFRPVRGGLAEAMLECVRLEPTLAALREHLGKPGVSVRPYAGADERIGWRETCLVVAGGYPQGYTDGMPEVLAPRAADE